MFNTLIFLAFLGREQPPLRGCVLKLCATARMIAPLTQPPLRGCVLKLCRAVVGDGDCAQPPLRGCVLKPVVKHSSIQLGKAAASARLCVETFIEGLLGQFRMQPPLRGCVLKQVKQNHYRHLYRQQPPLRGCVLKPGNFFVRGNNHCAAASARLCVETSSLD